MEEANTFLSETLPNGVQVVGQPMAGVESAAIGILVGTGARDETTPHWGISHFAEQMLSRGTETMDARQLSEAFDAQGIDYDFSAGLEMTLLSAVLVGNRLPVAVDLLAEVVHRPSFPEDAMDAVRTVILQEIRQLEDRPAQKVMDLVRRSFFAGSPLSHDFLGSEETVQGMTREAVVRYWQERATANNIIFSVAGNFEWAPLLEQVRGVTAEWPQGRGRMTMEAPAGVSGREVVDKDASQENICFAFPGVAAGDPRYYAAGLLAQALGGSSNSRLFQEVREKRGLAYSVQARFDAYERAGFYRVYVGTDPDRADESVEVVMDELRKMERDGITQEELSLSTTRLKSQVIMRSESTYARMSSNLRNWWYEQRLYTLEEVRDRIDAVTLEDIRSLAGSLGMTSTLNVAGIGPRSEDELFAGILSHT